MVQMNVTLLNDQVNLEINPEGAQGAISKFIFHRLDCSKLSH